MQTDTKVIRSGFQRETKTRLNSIPHFSSFLQCRRNCQIFSYTFSKTILTYISVAQPPSSYSTSMLSPDFNLFYTVVFSIRATFTWQFHDRFNSTTNYLHIVNASNCSLSGGYTKDCNQDRQLSCHIVAA